METSAKASVNVEEVSLLYKNQDKQLHSSSKQHVSNELTRDCLHLITRDALKGHTVSKNGSISFFFFSSSYTQIGTLIYSLNSPLSYSGCIVLIVFNKSRPIKIHSCRLYCEGGDPLTPTCVMSMHHLIYLLKTD